MPPSEALLLLSAILECPLQGISDEDRQLGRVINTTAIMTGYPNTYNIAISLAHWHGSRRFSLPSWRNQQTIGFRIPRSQACLYLLHDRPIDSQLLS